MSQKSRHVQTNGSEAKAISAPTTFTSRLLLEDTRRATFLRALQSNKSLTYLSLEKVDMTPGFDVLFSSSWKSIISRNTGLRFLNLSRCGIRLHEAIEITLAMAARDPRYSETGGITIRGRDNDTLALQLQEDFQLQGMQHRHGIMDIVFFWLERKPTFYQCLCELVDSDPQPRHIMRRRME